jgi:hypothetical protein
MYDLSWDKHPEISDNDAERVSFKGNYSEVMNALEVWYRAYPECKAAIADKRLAEISKKKERILAQLAKFEAEEAELS